MFYVSMNLAKVKKSPTVVAGWTVPRWCYDRPFKVAPLPRWSKVQLRRTARRHGLTIFTSEKKPRVRRAMLRKHIWTLGCFLESQSRDFSFCLNLCRTWRLHWSRFTCGKKKRALFFLIIFSFSSFRAKTTTATWTTRLKQEWFILPKVYSISKWIKHLQVS